MDLRIDSRSWALNSLEISMLIRKYAEQKKAHTLDIWMDACRDIAVKRQLNLRFEVTAVPLHGNDSRIGNRLTAVFYDQGNPAVPRTDLPELKLWRGRKGELGWETGQLVWDGDQMYIMRRDDHAGWIWIAVDQVKESGDEQQ